jgi:hypothetical protein
MSCSAWFEIICIGGVVAIAAYFYFSPDERRRRRRGATLRAPDRECQRRYVP